jgi:hypothetical protein
VYEVKRFQEKGRPGTVKIWLFQEGIKLITVRIFVLKNRYRMHWRGEAVLVHYEKNKIVSFSKLKKPLL